MKNRSQGANALDIKLKAGAHAALVYSDPAQLAAALAFIAEGLGREETCAVLAYSRFSERVGAQLRDLHGVDVRKALADGNLAFISGQESAKALRAELVRHFGKARKPARPARLLVSLGWGEEGWPDDNELLQFDVQLNEVCAEHGIACLCLYDARQLGGSLILHGALECHPVVYSRGVALKNPFFVDPDVLTRELGARRREDGRLRAWMT